jgi:hypothetical protein
MKEAVSPKKGHWATKMTNMHCKAVGQMPGLFPAWDATGTCRTGGKRTTDLSVSRRHWIFAPVDSIVRVNNYL